MPTRLGAAALTAAAILGTTALVNARRARQAERNNPPAGHFLDIEGVGLHYLERGEGPPLVLLHGNGVMVQDFEISGIIERLAQQYRVIAFDRPGFGHTNRPRSRSWTPAAQAEVVHKALAHLNIKQAIVVGHSWGTLVALSLALDHPADVRTLVLLSGYYFPTFRGDALSSLPNRGPHHWRSAELHGRAVARTCNAISRVPKAFCAGCRTTAFSSGLPERAVTTTISAQGER